LAENSFGYKTHISVGFVPLIFFLLQFSKELLAPLTKQLCGISLRIRNHVRKGFTG
jgi:hypothetical protein